MAEGPFPFLAGLAMAGGQSRRMGTDKALLRLGEGPTFLDCACAKLSRLASVWHVSCARGKPRAGYPCLEDALENFGPLAGILKGLENARENKCQALLVLACDLPLMPLKLLAGLLASYRRAWPRPLLAVYQNSRSGLLEMQAAVYDARALPFFQEAARKGEGRLATALPAASQLRLPYSSDLDPFFLNCNRPEDLENIRRLAERRPIKKILMDQDLF